jgi:tRNA 2-thiouridine synthesizing protein E
MADSMKDILHPGSGTGPSAAFPHAPQDWSEAAATEVAQSEGLTLDDNHWEVVRALQEYFARNAQANIRELHDALDEKFHAQGGRKFLFKLLPGGPVAQGCRLAGLTPPAGAESKSFGSVQ